jgi:hypothetical protein
VTVYNNGKAEHYRTSERLASAIKQLDETETNFIVKILSVPAGLLRSGATMTPDFAIKNVMRDLATATIVGSQNLLLHPTSMARGVMAAITHNKLYHDAMAAGVGMGDITSVGKENLQSTKLETIFGKTGNVFNEAYNGVRAKMGDMESKGLISGEEYTNVNKFIVKPWEYVKFAGRLVEATTKASEHMTRLTEFDIARRSGMSDAAAAYEARDLLDFSRRGSIMKNYSLITAFMNAGIQGLDKAGRSFKERPGATTVRALIGITLPSIVLALANGDDERIKPIARWQKDLFWLIPVDDHGKAEYDKEGNRINYTVYRIPKPFEIGVIFGSVPERVIEFLRTHDKDAFNSLRDSLTGAFTPNIIPTAVSPLIENWRNKSSFTDRPIVGRGQEKLLPKYQAHPYTSEISKGIASIVSNIPGLSETAAASPAKIENVIKGYTGGVGQIGLAASDYFINKLGIGGKQPEKPSLVASDYPILKSFIARTKTASTEPVNQFYKYDAEIESALSSYKEMLKQDNTKEAESILKKSPIEFINLSYAKNNLSKINKAVKIIYADPTMTSDQKRIEIDKLNSMTNQIAELVNTEYKKAEKTHAQKYK